MVPLAAPGGWLLSALGPWVYLEVILQGRSGDLGSDSYPDTNFPWDLRHIVPP